jgi:tetratricopeptide (TPR) repeat protein
LTRQFDEAEQLLHEAVEIEEKLGYPPTGIPRAAKAALADLREPLDSETKLRERLTFKLRSGADRRGIAMNFAMLADAVEQRGGIDEALQLREQSLRRFAELFGEESAEAADAISEISRMLSTAGKREEYRAFWRERLEYLQKELSKAETPDRRAEVLLKMYIPFLRLGEYDRAKSTCRTALSLGSTRVAPNVLNYAAWYLATAPQLAGRDPALALDLAQRAAALRPEDRAIRNTLGVARYRAGDYAGAVADLEKSVKLGSGGDSSDFFFLAMAHNRLGDAAASRSWYDKAVQWMGQKAPKNEELIRFRAEAEEALFGRSLTPTTAPSATSRPAN